MTRIIIDLRTSATREFGELSSFNDKIKKIKIKIERTVPFRDIYSVS